MAARLCVTPNTAAKWRQRFAEHRVEALVTATLESVPKDVTHWSSRGMAWANGLSVSIVQRIWHAFGLQPHRLETFKLSTAPDLADPGLVDQAPALACPPDADQRIIQLKAATAGFIDQHNADPKPFRWTKSASDILASVERFCARAKQTEVALQCTELPVQDSGACLASRLAPDRP